MMPFSTVMPSFRLSRNGSVKCSIGDGLEDLVGRLGDCLRIFHVSESGAESEFPAVAALLEEIAGAIFGCAKSDAEQTSEMAMRRRIPVIGASFDTMIIALPVWDPC